MPTKHNLEPELLNQRPPPHASDEAVESRTERKDDIEDLRRLGAELIALHPAKFERLTVLPDDLREAIEDYKKIPSYSAKKRQLQTIGRIMVGIDRVLIRKAILKLDHPSTIQKARQAAVAAPSEAELLADRLLEGGDAAVFALTDRYDRDDLQVIRQAVRLGRKQVEAGSTRAVAAKSIVASLARLTPLS